MRTALKGGVWKNSEDEILKAAVMKYGLNNWSRVASLLVRKSAKQCKSRWYEWLDPSVKKIEWSRDEEEKLLHLAKLFPNQWRTIAPVVGRTAHQCLEHYEKLLDEAQGRTEEDRLNDPRNLRPGEIDPHPETKPSRADAVDMEDDEKEMLAEARARLANTRGKKAKRKAREKQLDEARRLAALQKRRESKAAGIVLGKWKKKKDTIDYGNEIPLEVKPPKGFHAVGPEETPIVLRGAANINLQELEGKRRLQEERRLRKEDTRRLKRLMDENLPEAMRTVEKINDLPREVKSIKLTLPEPQLSDNELSEIMKIGSNDSKISSSLDIHSDQLLRDDISNKNIVTMTPIRTPMVQNSVLLEAQNALARNIASNPLEGGEVPELIPISLGKGASVDHVIPRTPNPLGLSAFRSNYMTTPLFGLSTAIHQPLNTNEVLPVDTPMSSVGSETESMRLFLREKVIHSLSKLPEPQNEIEISLPSTFNTPTAEKVLDEIEDAEEREKQDELKKNIEKQKEFKRRTQSIQRDLPRPLFPELIVFDQTTENVSQMDDKLIENIESLLNDEMYTLVVNDAVKFPLPVKGLRIPPTVPSLEKFTDNELEYARYLLNNEISDISKTVSYNDLDPILQDELASTWNDMILNEFVYDPSEKSIVSKSEIDDARYLNCMKDLFKNLRDQLMREFKKTSKMKQKLLILVKGYEDRIHSVDQSIDTAWSDLVASESDYDSFLSLEKAETQALQNRKIELQKLVRQQKDYHTNLQCVYADIKSRVDELNRSLQITV